MIIMQNYAGLVIVVAFPWQLVRCWPMEITVRRHDLLTYWPTSTVVPRPSWQTAAVTWPIYRSSWMTLWPQMQMMQMC